MTTSPESRSASPFAPALRALRRWSVTATLVAVPAFVAIQMASLAPAPAQEAAVVLPRAAFDTPSPSGSSEIAVLAGGCFWGVQAVFQHVEGVKVAMSGYAGGAAETATYMQVGSGMTGHAESVEVTFDPNVISYGEILRIYFSVAHDPTQLNRQGPDWGTQYRSEIFYTTDTQREIAEAYVAQLDAAKVFPDPIVTRIEPLQGFYAAEDYHQDYLLNHPTQPYIVINDLPKVENLARLFPEYWQDTPTTIASLR